MLTQFQRWRQQRKLKTLIEQARQTPATAPARHITLELLQQLIPESFVAYQVYTGAATRMQALARNIEAYTILLKAAYTEVANERAMTDPKWAALTPHELSVDRFLVTEDGYYVDQIKAVQAFRSAGIDLCNALAPADQASSGVYEHNLRSLTKLLVNLRAVAVALLQVSQEP